MYNAVPNVRLCHSSSDANSWLPLFICCSSCSTGLELHDLFNHFLPSASHPSILAALLFKHGFGAAILDFLLFKHDFTVALFDFVLDDVVWHSYLKCSSDSWATPLVSASEEFQRRPSELSRPVQAVATLLLANPQRSRSTSWQCTHVVSRLHGVQSSNVLQPRTKSCSVYCHRSDFSAPLLTRVDADKFS